MSSVSEQSFGARLLRGLNLLVTIQNFQNYSPPNSQDTVASMTILLNDINQANNQQIEQENLYKEAVYQRQDAFYKNTHSVIKLLSPLRAAVLAQYGRKSAQYDHIIKHIHPLRNYRQITPSSTTISHVELSYGAIHRQFADLVLTLEQLADFSPSNAQLQPSNLKIFLNTLDTMNNQVSTSHNALRTQRQLRADLYQDLHTRTSRIKAYVLAQYGKNSNEYAALNAI